MVCKILMFILASLILYQILLYHTISYYTILEYAVLRFTLVFCMVFWGPIQGRPFELRSPPLRPGTGPWKATPQRAAAIRRPAAVVRAGPYSNLLRKLGRFRMVFLLIKHLVLGTVIFSNFLASTEGWEGGASDKQFGLGCPLEVWASVP